MPRLHTVVLLSFIVALVLSGPTGCGGDDEGNADPQPDATDVQPDESEVTMAELEVGFHPPDANAGLAPPGEGGAPDLSEFTLITEGVQLPVHFGNQGSSMVVLGLQTQGFTEPIAIDIALSVNGDPLSSLLLEQLSFTMQDGGWSYLFNLFVAFDGCEMFPEGSPGTLSVTVRDGTGLSLERTFSITMGANDFCFG